MRVETAVLFRLRNIWFFGKQKFGAKQLKMNKFIFNVKQLKMSKFIFDAR